MKYVFSAPGRTEISGNHTDHQRGRVLAAAVNLKTTASVTPNDSDRILVKSEGYPPVILDLGEADCFAPRPGEINTTAALIRGTAAAFAQRGAEIKGFDAEIASTVLPGSGLSSSAAFEVLLGNIFNTLFFGGRLDAVAIAQIGQWAENKYFGKPCGLMDQMASSVGGMVYIDFEDPAAPLVEKISFDFAKSGYALCIIDSGASHADLTDEYAAIPGELKTVCAHFGREVLREIPEEDFYRELAALRREAGDRAVLRAIHVYNENKRVLLQKRALENGDFDGFLALVRASGSSSWRCLQNVIPAGRTRNQEVAFALALTEKLLDGRGACRVHGGGFAGTIQAFVPLDAADAFVTDAEATLGRGMCHRLSIVPEGGRLESTAG